MAEHQSVPGRRMAARMSTQTGMLYEALRADLRDVDGRFPALLAIVVFAGDEAWREAADLSALVESCAVPMAIAGLRYLLLDLEKAASEAASEHPPSQNRFSAFARLTFASSEAEAMRLLAEVRGWLDLADEDESRLLQDLVDWFHALAQPDPSASWYHDETRAPEETMGRLPTLETNIRRAMERNREEGMARGVAQGAARQRAMLVRQAAHRFGTDWGRRLDAALRGADDPAELDRAAHLILDCATGQQLLGRLNGRKPSA